MKILSRFGAFAAILSLCLGASAAQAASYGASLNTDVNTGVNTGAATLNANVDANANSNARVNKDIPNNKGTSSKALSSAAANASENARLHANANSAIFAGSTTASTSGTSSRVMNHGSTTVITRGDLEATATSTLSASDVASDDDFRGFVKSTMSADENLTRVETNDDQVKVWYNEPAKFLGFIPVTVSTQATVNADGTVMISHPWWYGMFVKDETSATLENTLSTTAGTIARASASGTISSSDKARLVNAVHSVMRTQYESTTGTTSVEMRTY